MDAPSEPSRYPCLTPSLIASSRRPPVRWTSWPSSTKQTTNPVSWQYGIRFARAISAFSLRIWSTCLPAGERSVASARSKARSMSGSSSRFASMQSFFTASTMTLAWTSRMLELELLHELAHGGGRLLERRLLVRRERDLDDLLDARAAELHRHADVEPLHPVLAVQVRRARQDLLLVLEDRLEHLDRRGGRRIVRAPALEERDDLRAAVGRALHERVDRVLRQELRDRDAGDGRIARQRHHRVTVAAQHEGRDVLDGDPELPRDERPEARGVEDPRHADDPLGREARPLPRELDHRVERVRHADQDRVLRARDHLVHDAPDDLGVLEQQIVARHPGFAGEAGGDDDDIGVRRLVVPVRADQVRVVAMHRTRLRQIQRLALGDALDDVHEHDVSQLLLDGVLRDGGADVAGADHGDLGTGSHGGSPDSATAWPCSRRSRRRTRSTSPLWRPPSDARGRR